MAARVLSSVIRSNKNETLEDEYVDKFNGKVCRLFWYLDFFRLENSLLSTLRTTTMIVLLNVCCLFFIHRTVAEGFLSTSELVMAIVLTLYGNSMFLNVNFINRKSYFKMLKVFLEIDEFIGIRETKFMRDITFKLFRLQILFYFFITCSTIFILTISYSVYETQVLVFGLLMIAIMYGAVIYIHCLVISYLFLSMRVRYLNISLLKLYNMDQYNIFIRKALFFDVIIWKEHFVDLVELKTEHLEQAYRLMLKLLRHMEASFQFLLFSGACLVTTGLFLGIHFVINYLKYGEPVNKIRLVMITLWIPLSWMLKIFTGLIVDIFLNEITSAQLICMDMMLDASLDEKYRQIAESIFQLLEVHDPQFSVYGMYTYNSTTVIKSSTAMVAFIIIQLQYYFPSKLDAKNNL